MNIKVEITKKSLESLGLDSSDDNVKRTIPVWWHSTRKKGQGGLRLTDQGFQALKNAGIHAHRITFDGNVYLTNQILLKLDHYLDCPWFLTTKEIYVFSDHMAVQLILFSGDLYKYIVSKTKHINRGRDQNSQ